MEFIIILILLGNLVLTFLLWQKLSQQTETLKQVLENQADHLSDQLDYRLEQESQKKGNVSERAGISSGRPFERGQDRFAPQLDRAALGNQ